MKAQIYDRIQLTADIKADFSDRTIPSGTTGTVIECYEQPEEGYSVDLAIPSQRSVTGFEYESVILKPMQFTVIEQSAKAVDSSSRK